MVKSECENFCCLVGLVLMVESIVNKFSWSNRKKIMLVGLDLDIYVLKIWGNGM